MEINFNLDNKKVYYYIIYNKIMRKTKEKENEKI